MARFCTKCGKELSPDGVCSSCLKTSDDLKENVILEKVRLFASKMFSRMGLGGDTEKETADFFERGKNIIPDVVVADENEIPIKQYDIANLRSRILGKFGEGRLQVTNKRVIFRAPGISYSGKIVTQCEFSLNEIGVIEIKKSTRVSFLNLILSFFLSLFIMIPLGDAFEAFNSSNSVLALIVGLILSLICIAPFFLLRKKFWIKLIGTSAAVGILDGVVQPSSKVFNFFLGENLFDFVDTILWIIALVWMFNIVLVALVPDLRLGIKTNSASEAIEVRRKVWSLFKEPKEYSGFSEVVPWTDAELASKELGAMIHELQTMGDYAIEKWKEN